MYPFALPEPFERLARFIADDPRHLEVVERALGEPDPRVFTASTDARELGFLGAPPELFPLLWSGSLHYGVLAHDVALPPVFVSYAPGDHGGPRFLADDAPSCIARLLAVTLRDRDADWGEGARAGDDLLAETLADTHAAVHEISTVLGIAPDPNIDDLSEGARSARPATPPVPDGWYFDDCNDDVGVLARRPLFDLASAPGDEAVVFELEREVRSVESFLANGHPASALALARNLFWEFRGEPGDGHVGARLMKRAYIALGRDFLADRIGAYLAHPRRSLPIIEALL